MNYKNIVLAILLSTSAASAVLMAPVAQAQVRGSVDIRIGTPPPPPRYERMPPPRRGFVWAPGYWAWDGYRHVWVQGHWERVRRGYHHYAPPGWRQDRDGWRFNQGGWER